jgi:MFS family permease
MLQFAVCLLGYALCNLLLGPSLWLHFPDSVWLPVLSFPIQGVMQVLVFIPVLPEMIERMQVKLKISEGEDEILDGQLNDKINDMYGLIYAGSMFVSPLVGSALSSTYGVRKTCDYVAAGNVAFFVLYFLFNGGFFMFAENKRFKAELLRLQGAGESDVISKAKSVQSGSSMTSSVYSHAHLVTKNPNALKLRVGSTYMVGFDSYKQGI